MITSRNSLRNSFPSHWGSTRIISGVLPVLDFDGTLCYSNWPDLGEPNRPLIEYLQAQQKSGNKLILWTCRAGEALEKAVSWCKDQDLTFEAVNDNLPEVIEMYGTNSRKITCDYYIDDKAILPEAIRA